MKLIAKYISLLLLSGVLAGAQDEPRITEPQPATDAPQPTANTEVAEPENKPAEKAEPAEQPEPPEPPERPERPERARGNRDWGNRNWGNRVHHGGPIFGQNTVVQADESVNELVIIGGSADIQGEVRRDVVAIGAKVKLTGSIGGSLVIVAGEGDLSGEVGEDTVMVMSGCNITEKAQLGGDAVMVGGPINISPDASIDGERVTVPLPFGDVLPKIEWIKQYSVSGPLLGRWLTFNLAWPWFVAGTFAAIYLATLLVFPAAARAVYVALEERPVTSIFTGLLSLILLAPLLFLLIVSVVGILVIPFLKIALILALLFGKVGVICFLGRGAGKTTGVNALQAPLLAFVVGAIILMLAYAVPLFGIFAWGVATVFGLGGAIVALSNTFKREEANVPPAPGLVSTVRSEGSYPGTGTMPAASEQIPGSGGAATATMVAPPVVDFTHLNPQDTILLPRAGFWARFLATFLDLFPVTAAVIALPVIGPALFVPIAVTYFVAMWAWKGTTIGGLVLGHKIVRTDGRPVTFAVALVRSLTSLFSALIVFLGFLWAGWDREKQTWHDKIAGTVVVKMPRGFSLL